MCCRAMHDAVDLIHSMKRLSSFACLLIWILAGSSLLQAKPDFSASEITLAKEPVVEGDVAVFQLTLRNTGDSTAESVQLRVHWPLMGYLLEMRGLDQLQTDQDERVATGSLTLPKGGEHKVELAVLAPRDSGGDALSVSVQVVHFHTMVETWLHKTITVDTRPRSDGIVLGGVRITAAGLVTLAWLTATLLAMMAASVLGGGGTSFFGPRTGVAGIMIAVGFWAIFVTMAWRDYRILSQWKETTGTIVGRRVATQTVSNSQRRSSGSGMESRSADVSKPEFALRYFVDGREMLSTGYDTGSSLRVGGGKAQLEREFRDWTVGKQVPCWYDPQEPADVVLKRGFGGAYLFSLLPLFPFWVGWRILRQSRSR